mmetsp:Transcript_12546/g.18951  ORF Transcript_12546/g.18951 Transcript_12546/m.18951 type:complete len:83 (-) Transcript_12546:112-360(-)
MFWTLRGITSTSFLLLEHLGVWLCIPVLLGFTMRPLWGGIYYMKQLSSMCILLSITTTTQRVTLQLQYRISSLVTYVLLSSC